MTNQKFTLIKLRNFRSGIHLSKGRTNSYSESQEALHSDTLKSAIFVCALKLYGKNNIDKAFLESFQISSAFPFCRQNGRDIYFFPKPLTKLPIDIRNKDGNSEKNKVKNLKKLAYLETKLFEQVINGENITLTQKEDIEGKYAGFNLEEEPKIFKNDAFQHVSIPRDGTSDSTPYYVDKRYFYRGAGLFFLLNCKDLEVKKKIIGGLRLLADSGIGTDRNNGNGIFEFRGMDGEDIIESFALRIPERPNYDLSLSLYLPKSQTEIGDIKKAQYQLQKRGGYIANPENSSHLTLRKRSVFMFSEGSLFEYSNARTGDIANLQPNSQLIEKAGIDKFSHPIYRDGQAIFIPCKIQNQ